MRRKTLFSLLPILASLPDQTLACATCLCGDPTITTMGAEKPFAGRTRFNLNYLVRGEQVGETGISEHKIEERRYTYSASYAVSSEWIIGVSLPLVKKEVTRYDLSREQASGVGDSDLSARWFADNGRRHLWGLQYSLRLPTSTEQTSGSVPIDFDAQPGAGATVPGIGIWYSRFSAPSFVYTSVAYQHAVDTGYQGYEAGDVVLATAHLQYDFNYTYSLSFSLDGRWKQADSYFGVSDDDSGGTLIMATPGMNWTPATDWVVSASLQLPVVENLNGRQNEDSSFRLDLTYDF